MGNGINGSHEAAAGSGWAATPLPALRRPQRRTSWYEPPVAGDSMVGIDGDL